MIFHGIPTMRTFVSTHIFPFFYCDENIHEAVHNEFESRCHLHLKDDTFFRDVLRFFSLVLLIMIIIIIIIIMPFYGDRRIVFQCI